MGYLIETSEWLEQIFREETTTPITGGLGGTSNRQALELSNRTQKIKSILKDNSIYIDDTEFEYGGQNIIFVDPNDMIGISDFVYWRYSYDNWFNARLDAGEEAIKVVGRGIYGDWSPYEVGVAIGGILPTTLLNLVPGQNVYLGLNGSESDVDGGVYLGYYIKPGLIRFFIRDYFHADPIASIFGLRTLGTTSNKACAGNDSRLIHTGDVTSDSSGITIIENNKVTEAKQNLTDITTHNFSTTMHGYVPKGTNVGHYLKDDGTWAPAGGSNIIQSALYGDIIIGRQDTELSSTTSSIFEEFTIPLVGNYRIKWDFKGYTGDQIYIYKNSQIIGGSYNPTQSSMWESFSVDISGWNAGDLCQIGGVFTSNINLRNFRLCVGNPCVGASYLIYWNNVNKVTIPL